MIDTNLNTQWRIDFFNIFSKDHNNKEELENADKIKFSHFPPVIAKFYTNLDDVDLQKICDGKIQLKKAKLSRSYHGELIDINYEETIKTQLNNVMQQQIDRLMQEDPYFLKDDEKEEIEKADFPFIKLMTLVYSKDTDDMTKEDQEQWKTSMNQFINDQILFAVVNTYFTMKLYHDNIYTTTFQTPYNKIHTWDKYADNNRGICITYDFKEINNQTALLLSKLYPVIYTDKKMTIDDFDHKIYNSHCANLIKIDDNVNEEDNSWEYLESHKYTEKEYNILNRVLEPIYEKAMNYPKLKEISQENNLMVKDSNLEYDYKKFIADIDEVLTSDEFNNQIKDSLEDVYGITPDTMEIEFRKPEAIYLGVNFPEEKVEQYNKAAQDNDIKIFQIKEGNDMLYKSLI